MVLSFKRAMNVCYKTIWNNNTLKFQRVHCFMAIAQDCFFFYGIVLHSEHVEMKETSEKLLKIIITLSGTQLVLKQ